MTALNEKRQSTRMDIDAAVLISDKSANTFKGQLQNLSPSGALIKTKGQLQPGKQCCLSIQLPGDNSDISVNNLWATVVRLDTDTVAVAFSNTMEWLALFYIYKQKMELRQKQTQLPPDKVFN